MFRASGHSEGLLFRMDRFRSQRALCDVTLIAGEAAADVTFVTGQMQFGDQHYLRRVPVVSNTAFRLAGVPVSYC